jgi:hypothetical protein
MNKMLVDYHIDTEVSPDGRGRWKSTSERGIVASKQGKFLLADYVVIFNTFHS